MNNTTRPLLSIVIPTLNRAALVGRAVESALAQTSMEIEVIVSDNGSTDETQSVLARLRDPRLRHIRHEKTMPATEHGNFLIAQAGGEYFLGLSDDDYLEPSFADRVLDLLGRRPDLAFVYTGCVMHFGDVPVRSLGGPETERGTDFIAAFYAGRREVCWCACVTRVADLRRLGPLPSGRIFGDMFFWTQLAFEGDVGCVAEPVAHYMFMTTDNVSGGTPASIWGGETRLLADEVLARWARTQVEGPPAGVRHDCDRFVARSTANQFVWTAIRGARRAQLLRDLSRCLGLLHGDLSVWLRVAAGLLLPRQWQRRVLLGAATRLATARAIDSTHNSVRNRRR